MTALKISSAFATSAVSFALSGHRRAEPSRAIAAQTPSTRSSASGSTPIVRMADLNTHQYNKEKSTSYLLCIRFRDVKTLLWDIILLTMAISMKSLDRLS
jgi:hypothetical protein